MRRQKGFTLIELLVVVAIISILASIGMYAYQDYTRRTRATELVLATEPFKLGITECYMTGPCYGSPDWWELPKDIGLNNQALRVKYGLPLDITNTPASSAIKTVAFWAGQGGVTIVVAGKPEKGFTGDAMFGDFALDGKAVNGAMQWTASGPCFEDGYCKYGN